MLGWRVAAVAASRAAAGVRAHAGTGLRGARGPSGGCFGLLEAPGACLGARPRAVRAQPTAAMRYGGGELRSSWRQRLQHGREQGRKGKDAEAHKEHAGTVSGLRGVLDGATGPAMYDGGAR